MPYPDNMNFAAITEDEETPEQAEAIAYMEKTQAAWIDMLAAVEGVLVKHKQQIPGNELACMMESYEELLFGLTRHEQLVLENHDVSYKPANADDLIVAALVRINA